MFGQDRQTSFERFFIVFDFPKASKEEFVIKVDLRSIEVSKLTLGDWKNLLSPLSLKAEHFERLRLRREVMKGEVESAYKVSLVMSVQLKLRFSRFFTVELFKRSTRLGSSNLLPSSESSLKLLSIKLEANPFRARLHSCHLSWSFAKLMT